MRKTLHVILLIGVLLMASGVVVFHYFHNLDWLDAFYFVVTIMTTVGFGDIHLAQASPAIKIFGCFLMLTSAVFMAALFGVITDILLQARLDVLFGPRRSRMRNHIVLCGLGHVGIRILEELHKIGEEVVVVENSPECRFLDEARKMNVPVVMGDMRTPAVLERVNIMHARSLIAATGNDLVNLEAALNAREVRPDIRVVLRMFDPGLAGKIRTGFGIKTTFSTSTLSAPAFAMAAVDPAVVGSFYVGEDLVLVVRVVVAADSKLIGQTLDRVANENMLSILSYEAAASGQRRLHPPDSLVLAAGDTLFVSAASGILARIKDLNG